MECPTCNGTGRGVFGGPCSACHGLGAVSQVYAFVLVVGTLLILAGIVALVWS